jgi:hypothetical protein
MDSAYVKSNSVDVEYHFYLVLLDIFPEAGEKEKKMSLEEGNQPI